MGQGAGAVGFAEWLRQQLPQGYTLIYDHGNNNDPNVGTIAGFVGNGGRITRNNQLTHVDIMVAKNNDALLLIEIEEHQCTPKVIIGDIMAALMCDGFYVRRRGLFRIGEETRLIVAGVRNNNCNIGVIRRRLENFNGFNGCIRPRNVRLVFTDNMDETMARLQGLIRELGFLH